nr:hypothetical protein BCU45_17790 [Vibrio lentus]PMJ57748.1 hypothetical protein BCU20_16360 [Vibrio lentus]
MCDRKRHWFKCWRVGVIFFAEVEILWESFAFWVCWVMAELWIRLVWGGLDWDLIQVLGANKGYRSYSIL